MEAKFKKGQSVRITKRNGEVIDGVIRDWDYNICTFGREYNVDVSVSAILSCRPFFILIFLLCIKMKHYGFSRKSIWKNLETFP